jgi:hypothetical protein
MIAFMRGTRIPVLVIAIPLSARMASWCQVVGAPPVSTSLDQECVEDFGRFLPVECLPWTVVELVGDGIEFGLCVI